MMRKSTIAAITALLMVIAAPALAQESASLDSLNDSGATSTAEVTLDGTSLTVSISGTGFAPDQPHAQHIHFAPGTDSTCPGADADADGDDLVSTAEGVPFYGSVQFSLTESGDFGPDSALAVDRFPVADSDGNLEFEVTYELDQAMADSLTGQAVAIVQHGIDLDDSGAYDGDAESSLDPSLPLEATIPATCGVVTVQAAADDSTTTTAADDSTTTTAADDSTTTTAADDAAPAGGADTGAGGTSDDGTALAIAAVGALAIGTGFMIKRRVREQS